METETEKKPRGRPPILDWGQLMNIGMRYPRRSDRTLMNLYYAEEALAALDIDGYARDHPLRWLTHDRDGEPYLKHGILTELGRLLHSHGLEAMALAAKDICEIKPTVKDGMATLRQLRLGKQPAASVEGLANDLLKTFSTYRATHDEISEVDAIRAVQTLAEQVAKNYGVSAESDKDQ